MKSINRISLIFSVHLKKKANINNVDDEREGEGSEEESKLTE